MSEYRIELGGLLRLTLKRRSLGMNANRLDLGLSSSMRFEQRPNGSVVSSEVSQTYDS